MEKLAKSPLRETPRKPLQPSPAQHAHSPAEDIRRQLGWGLVEFARKGALR